MKARIFLRDSVGCIFTSIEVDIPEDQYLEMEEAEHASMLWKCGLHIPTRLDWHIDRKVAQ
jgi:hypothetical protein